MAMKGEFSYALCVNAKELSGAIKMIQFARGKNAGFLLGITTRVKDGMHCCTLSCVGDTVQVQGTSIFNASLRILKKNKNGGSEVINEPLKNAVYTTMSSLFAEVVFSYAEMEEMIFFEISDSMVEAYNSDAIVPIPVKEKDTLLISPKTEKLILTLYRAELTSALRYVRLAAEASNSPFANRYGICPVYSSESATLKIAAMTNTTVATADVVIHKLDREDLPSLCSEMPFTMLDASKVDQILSVNESEEVQITIYFKRESTGIKVIQVNIKTPQCWYMLKPFVNAFPSTFVGIVDAAYETKEYSISVDAKQLRNSLSVLGLGCDSSKDKRIEFHVHRDHILICDEGAQNGKGKYCSVKVKEVVTQLPEGTDETVLVMRLRQLLKNIKPYEGKLSIIQSSTLVVFSGTDERIRHGISPCTKLNDNQANVDPEDPALEDVEK